MAPHRELFQAVAAKAPDGTPCCDWLGPDGGPLLKMSQRHRVRRHAGRRAYHLMKRGLDVP